MKIQLDLRAKGAVVGGLRGTGKTNLARYIAQAGDKSAVLAYDPLGQYPEYDRIEPRRQQFPEAPDEFMRVLDKDIHIFKGTAHPYRVLLVDEAHRVAPSGHNLHRGIARLNHEHRHIPLAIVWISRRPRELHPEIVNLADHIMIFRLPGATDARFLEDTAKGLAEQVRALEEWCFVYLDPNRRFYTMAPVPELAPPEEGA